MPANRKADHFRRHAGGIWLSDRKEEQMRITLAVAAVVSLTMLAACGRQEPERAEGGAAAGAATGATVGLVGGPVGVVAGGAIGAVAGGATGAATKPSTVNMGSPPWHDNSQAGQTAAQHMNN
jgi:phage tail tape-measure protein